ncbi:nucleoside triphosphate pyrophosphohydrolase [Gracilibacillus phocaeensis]|uniref:nucleoside triphosphate pyrophosphohydrolase n=1 Tax=Gracilibacillus phocaeensis TaxID=2042304 RepID=UPI001030F724|nr:nucleoside triphosphate pyrophosphohydrolase [Gracilibacillus phocaeensis]
MTIYNKLVRDYIPEIIEEQGQYCQIRIMDEKSYKLELIQKLKEEWKEYRKANNDQAAVEELADMMEVVIALAKTHQVSEQTLLQMREQKLKTRGGFDNKIFLEEVSE